jgi:hypothetical protein
MQVNSNCGSNVESIKSAFMAIEKDIVDKLRSINVEKLLVKENELANPAVVVAKIERIRKMLSKIVQDVPAFLVRASELNKQGLIDLSPNSVYPSSTAFVQGMFSGTAENCKNGITRLYKLESIEDDLKNCMECCVFDLAIFNSITESAFGFDYLKSF